MIILFTTKEEALDFSIILTHNNLIFWQISQNYLFTRLIILKLHLFFILNFKKSSPSFHQSLHPSFQIVLTGTNARLETKFSPPLNFHAGCKYEIALGIF